MLHYTIKEIKGNWKTFFTFKKEKRKILWQMPQIFDGCLSFYTPQLIYSLSFIFNAFLLLEGGTNPQLLVSHVQLSTGC